MEQSHLREITLGALLSEAVEKWPDNEAVVYVDRDFRLTYSELEELVDDLAMGLMALGVKRGEKVAIWSTNVPYWVALQFAAAKIGAVLLTINTSYRSTEIESLLKQSECENIFIIDGFKDIDYLQTLYEMIPELRTQERGHLKSAKFPHLRRVFFLGQEKHRGMYSVAELINLSAVTTVGEYERRQVELDPHDVVNMQYTSETTGSPKGVQLTHYNVVNSGYWIGKNQGFKAGERLCLPVPLYHFFGCVLGVLAAVNHGVTMVVLEGFDPLLVMASIAQEKCNAVYGVPSMFTDILEHKLFGKFDYSSLRSGIMTGSACPVEVMKKVMDEMNLHEITICYGLTESSQVMTQTSIEDDIIRRTESVGRAMPGIEVAIISPESGKEVPHGTQGEICCRGYNVMKGYYNDPEATAAVIDADGWLHSGDLGVMDAQGYLVINGRLKDCDNS